MASEMELVNLFNAELSSLYDVKPPISKGKMTAITKAALKAVKLYKHVVQSVEKFIQKCKADYKIPGLYVIDSIIRQSRHQYGVEKDIFTTRFARNLQATFVHIYRCPEEDKPKVIRVLNLWQKNKIFQPEAIAPLFDLADPNNAIWETVSTLIDSSASGSGGPVNSAGNGQTSNNNTTASSFYNEIQFKSHLLDYDYDEDPEDGEKPVNTASTNIQPPPPPVIRSEPATSQLTVNPLAGIDALGSILSNPEVLRQLQTLQEQMTAAATAQAQQQTEYLTPEQERQRKLAELNKQEAAFDQRLAQTVAKTHFAVECGDFIEDQENKAKSPEEGFSGGPTDQNSNQLSHGVLAPPPFFQQLAADQGRVAGNPFGLPLNFPLIASQFAAQQQQSEQNTMAIYSTQLHGDGSLFPNFQQPPPQALPFDPSIQRGGSMDMDDDIIEIRSHRGDRNERDKNRNDRRRRRSRSRDRSRRSRSNDRSPSPRRSRGSRSSSRNHSSKRRDRSRERREEKERQRKGFGTPRREHLSVCSTTLWVGHLSKLVSQEELSDTFGQYGDVVSIDLIQSRGCAFVVMNRRQDAVRALDRLKKGTKLQGKEITLAWAPGKGVKGRDWKDYWEVDCGISYIPWTKLTPDTDLEEFEDGGCTDETTLPEFLKMKPRKEKPESEEKKSGDSTTAAVPGEGNSESTPTGAGIKEGVGTNGVATNDVDARTDLATSQIHVPTPVPPAVMPNPAAFGMPQPVGMLGVPPMALNMIMPPQILGGPMGMPQMPQFQLPGMMGMLGAGPLGMNPSMNDSPASQMKLPSGGPGLLGDAPLVQLENSSNISLQMHSANPIGDDEDKEDERKRTNPERGERERKRTRFNNPDEKYSPTRDIDGRSELPQQEQRSEEKLFDRLKSMAGGYALNNPGGNSDGGMSLANSLLGQPIVGGPPPLLGPRGPNNFRGGFRPFMNDRGGIRPWFDGGPPNQNPFMNPSPNPFVAAGGNPFISNDNPFDDRRGPKDRGEREFFGGPNERFHNKPNRGGWREGPPGPGPWRGRGGPPPMRGGRGGGGRWRHPKPNHNFIVNNN